MAVVEFLGVAGAGKTTIASQLTDRLSHSYDTVVTPRDLWERALAGRNGAGRGSQTPGRSRRMVHLRALWKHRRVLPRLSVHSLTETSAATFNPGLINFRSVVASYLAHYGAEERDIVILSGEGLTKTWAVAVRSRQRKASSDQVDWQRIRQQMWVIPRPDVLVHLRVSPDHAMRRVRSRTDRPVHETEYWRRMADMAWKRWIADSDCLFAHVAEELEKRDTKVLSFRTDDLSAVPGIVESLASAIAGRMRSPASRIT